MKVFYLLQRQFNHLGIYAPQAFDSFNWHRFKSVPILIYTGLFCILAGIHIIYKTNTLTEVSEGIYGFLSILLTLFILSIFCLQQTNFFKLIDSFESAIQTRELKKGIKL